MLDEPLGQAIGQELEEFVVVLARATPLPRRLRRHHLADHLRLLPKNALSKNG